MNKLFNLIIYDVVNSIKMFHQILIIEDNK